MRIVDLGPEHLEEYLVCLEDWNAETREGRDLRAEWYAHLRERGLLDAVFVDGCRLGSGPPLSYAKIRAAIARRLRRLRPGPPRAA
jgi:hypothetical protein